MLNPNVEMLAEMQDKLSQAVGLYGQILDGQQAYNARKLQEQQQRQYHQHQQYQHHQQQYQPQQQQYSPYPSQQYQSNGYPTYNAYPAQQYQPPPAQAGPSLYPSMPFGQADYAPPPQQPQQQQQQYQPYQYQGYNPQQQLPAQQSHQSTVVNGAPAQTSAPDSQYPYQQRSHPAMLGVNGRQASLNHSSEPQGYSTAASAPMLSPGIEPTQGQASAPPPVDIASHPASSPRSTTSRLASHTSPTGVAVPLPSSPEAQWQAQQAQAQYSQKRQQQPAQVYNVDSFPAAPAAVFPDAPVSEPHGLEKKEQEEALLIEL
jgi:growth factor-regulated tyrosine kinase substrate